MLWGFPELPTSFLALHRKYMSDRKERKSKDGTQGKNLKAQSARTKTQHAMLETELTSMVYS